MKALLLILSLVALGAQATDKRLNYSNMASDAIEKAENLAIADKKCAITENNFQTVYNHPSVHHYDFDHIVYKNSLPYAGYKNERYTFSYHEAVSGQWQYRVKVKPGQEVRFQKFLNRGSKLVTTGNQSVAKMNDYLYGPERRYRVFCATKEVDKINGFGTPSSTRYTALMIDTPRVIEAKAALKKCVDYWFVQPLKNDLCR